MANSITYAVAGKSGSLTIHSGQSNPVQLRLTKYGLHLKADKIDVTNTRSPTFWLGVAGGVASPGILSEWISGVLDGELTFEGEYVILDAATPTLAHLIGAFGSGSGATGAGMVPGASDVDAYNRASFSLVPDAFHYPSDAITGSCVIETFEIDGEVRGAVTFKGTASISGSLTIGSNL